MHKHLLTALAGLALCGVSAVVPAGTPAPEGAKVFPYVRYRDLAGGRGRAIRLPRRPEGEKLSEMLALCETLDRDGTASAPHRALGDALVGLGAREAAAAEYRASLTRIRAWDSERPAPPGDAKALAPLVATSRKWVEAAPADERAWFQLGYLLMRTGGEEARREAAACFRKALDLDPDSPQSLRLLREAQSR